MLSVILDDLLPMPVFIIRYSTLEIHMVLSQACLQVVRCQRPKGASIRTRKGAQRRSDVIGGDAQGHPTTTSLVASSEKGHHKDPRAPN